MDKIAKRARLALRHQRDVQAAPLMQGASHCGLGNSACNPVFDTLNKFRPAYERRLKSLDYEPAFDLDAALSQARQMTGRDDAGAHLSNEERHD
jgi:[NiFe] hydrogenase diaphorase moiety large subunit